MTVPVGTVLPYAGTAAPAEYLLCYGQAISRTTYPTLFSVIGTAFGTGNGTTTFNIPDLRGRAVAGKDNMGGSSANRLTGQSGGVDGDVLGDAGGGETHTLTEAEMPVHSHAPAGGYEFVVLQVTGEAQPPGSGSNCGSNPETGEAGGDDPHNNVQPTLILNYIIYTGPEAGTYVTEDGADDYVTEDGADNYVTENS